MERRTSSKHAQAQWSESAAAVSSLRQCEQHFESLPKLFLTMTCKFFSTSLITTRVAPWKCLLAAAPNMSSRMIRSSRPPSRSELLEYVSHGSKRPDDENRLLEKKTARVRRNLNLAFRRPSRSRAPQSIAVCCADATKEVYCITFSNQRAVRSLKTRLSHLEHGAQHTRPQGSAWAEVCKY